MDSFEAEAEYRAGHLGLTPGGGSRNKTQYLEGRLQVLGGELTLGWEAADTSKQYLVVPPLHAQVSSATGIPSPKKLGPEAPAKLQVDLY